MDGFGHGSVSELAPACCILFWSKTGGEFGQRRRSAGAAEGTELLQALFVQLSAAADAPLRPGVAFAPPPRVGFYVLESRAEPMTPAAASELHKIWVMSEVDDRTGASAGCAEVDGEVRVRLREAAEAEVSAAALRVLWAMCLAYDAACLPFGMVGEPRRKLSPITILVLLLSMGVDLMDIRVSAVFPSSRQRAAFFRILNDSNDFWRCDVARPRQR